ncbi:YkgJ family cysteine cluster protein [Microbispora amethystogenes]|uniref:YkgJ family cysteine cluster protein n=1 Tax=Microbispora amethystogenes TaxID=1427754 RepID=UPI0033EF1686
MSDWNDRRDEMLGEVYAKVPDAGCKGLCQDQCTSIAGSRREAQRMAEAGFPIPTTARPTLREYNRTGVAEPCAALGADGRCQAYEIRPLICRLWGSVQGLPCPHGCRPEGGLMPDSEASQLIRRAKRI